MKFALISALLGLSSESEALTDAHMTTAETKLGALQASEAALSSQVTALTEQLATAGTELSTAAAALSSAQGELTTAQATVTTLEKWKQEQAVVDGRREDASNEGNAAPKAAFEADAAAVIARVKANLGVQ